MTEKRGMPARLLLDAGIMAALSILLLFTVLYIPLLGSAAIFVWSVPLMIVVMRHNWPAGILCSLVVLAGAFLLGGGSVIGLSCGFILVVFGLAYGICFKRGVAPLRTVLIGTVVAGLITAASFLLLKLWGYFSFDAIINEAEKTVQQVLATYESMQLLDNLLPAGMTAEAYKTEILSAFRTLLPAFFILTAMLMAACNYLFAVLILRRLRLPVRPLPPFRNWHLPWWLVWGVIIALGTLFFGNRWNHEALLMVAQNILYVFAPISLLAGISLLAFIYHQFGLGTGGKVLFWLLFILFSTFTVPFAAFLGVFDMVIDYRKIFAGMKNRKDNNDN